MPGSEPKRHHLVPEFFLRRFADGDFVQLVDRGNLARTFPTNVDNALVQRHFYRVETDDGPTADIEQFFANHVEGPAARAIRRVVDEGRFPPLPGLRADISTFLAFQFVRGESMRETLVAQHVAIAKTIASLMTPAMARRHLRDQEGHEPTDEEVSDFVAFAHATDAYRVDFSRKENLHLTSALQIALDLVPYFSRRRWQLLTFAEPILVTGDEPIALIGESTRPQGAQGIAIAREVVISVDPRRAFVLARPDRVPEGEERSLKGTAAMARIINLNIAYACHRYIVHRPGTGPLRGIALPAKGPKIVTRGVTILMHARPGRRTPRRLRHPSG